MPYDIDKEPLIVRTAANVTAPAANVSAAEWTEYKDRVIAQENKALDDLTDVDASAPDDGDALLYDAGTDTWAPGTVTGAIEEVDNNAGWAAQNVTRMSFRFGLTASDLASGGIAVHPVYGGGGTANSVSRSDHTHSIRPDTQLAFSASGSFSSGTRTLVSGTVTGLDPARTYVLRGVLDVHHRGDGSGAGYALPRITINGNSVDMPERTRSVAGVQVCSTMRHPGVSVTGVSSVAVSATIAYSEGDATWVGGGALTISIEANR